jgi:hypothetical protein
MCLDIKGFRLVDNTRGEGWKIVRKTDKKDVFASYWPAFYADGNGGGQYMQDDPDLIKNNTRYTIGKPTTVKHNREAKLNGTDCFSERQFYPAMIHLYKSLGDVASVWQELGLNDRCNYEVIKCRYTKGVCEDASCVVARRVVPLSIEEGGAYGRV